MSLCKNDKQSYLFTAFKSWKAFKLLMAGVLLTNVLVTQDAKAAPKKAADICNQALTFQIHVQNGFGYLSPYTMATMTGSATNPLSNLLSKKEEAPTAAEKPAVRRILHTNDPNTKEINGLTEEGLRVFKKLRDDIQFNAALFKDEFLGLETVYRALMLARATKKNIFLFGPPGAAKSAIVKWMMSLDAPTLHRFNVQLHQMMNEMSLVGGQDFEAAKRGEYRHNGKNSLIDANIALLDEIDKASPAVLAVILSLLNEREFYTGHVTIKSALQTVFSTSNMNLPEINDAFMMAGMHGTAAAFMNRFQIKAYLHNWLDQQYQTEIDKRKDERDHNKAQALSYPEFLNSRVFQKPRVINWDDVAELAEIMFKTTPLFNSAKNEMINEYIRPEINKEIKQSRELNRKDQSAEPFPMQPTADWSERIRGDYNPLVRMSAMLDLLHSPLSADENIQALTSRRIHLDPLSLWRGYVMVTTVGPGDTQFKYDPDSQDSKYDIDWGWTEAAQPGKAKDDREAKMLENIQKEQNIFAKAFKGKFEKIQESLKIRAQFAMPGKDVIANTDFEILLATYNQNVGNRK